MPSKESILNDKLPLLLYRLSVPGVLSMLVISLNSFVDAVFAGRLIGPDALAGISLCIPLLVINSACTAFITSGASNVLSRAIGSGNKTVTSQIFAYVLIYCLLVSLLLGLTGYLFAAPLLKLIGAEKAVLREAVSYYQWTMAGSFTSIFGLACSALLRAEGKMKLSMRMTITGVLCNIVLNPLLIHYGNMGVKGSAIATIIAMGIYSLGLLKYLASGSSISLRMKGLHLEKHVAKDIASVGSSAMIMQASNFIRQLILFKMVTLYGDTRDEAFFAAVFRIFSFSLIPVFGLLQALQPIIGINFGAGNYPRTIQALWLFRLSSLGVMLLILLPIQLFPEPLLSLLLPGFDARPDDIFNFRLMMCILLIAPLSSTGIVFLQATANGNTASKLALGRELLLFIPILLILPRLMGGQGIYTGLFLENTVYMLIVLLVVQQQITKLSKPAPV